MPQNLSTILGSGLLQGATGTQGATGAQGTTGAGTQGTSGAQGTTGASGVKVINFVIDGGDVVIATGETEAAQSKGYVYCTFDATINDWTILGDASGTIKVDVMKAQYGTFPTMTLISGTNPPTLSAAQKNNATSLTAWGNTTIVAGDVLQFRVNSNPAVATVKRVTVSLNIA